MSSGQSSVSNLLSEPSSPSRKRPHLPPINSSSHQRHGTKLPSPTSIASSFSETRSSSVHGLLNHSEVQQRFTSTSPASSTGPVTPVTTLPPVNMLTIARPLYPPIGIVDAGKSSFLGRPCSPTSSKTSFPSLPRLIIQNDGRRRDSDVSVLSSTSPTTSMTSSSFGYRQSPPTHNSHASHQNTNGNFQYMTTTTGLLVPLDTHQASRVADEKRKRNAGASARFRQRRKEKEKESTSAISRLDSKVRELEEMNVWYRNERDHLRQVCISHGLQAHIGPRPASPRLTQQHMTPSNSNVSTPSDWQQQGERGNSQGQNQRRRVGDYFEGVQAIPRGQQRQQAGTVSTPTHNPHKSMSFVGAASFGSHQLENPSTRGSHHFEHQHERAFVMAR